jgi:hypothetical protein
MNGLEAQLQLVTLELIYFKERIHRHVSNNIETQISQVKRAV